MTETSYNPSGFNPLLTLQHISLPQKEIIKFCQHWQITQLALFGSVLRSDFDPVTSDIDILVDFRDNAGHTLLDFSEMQDQLTELFEQKVDLVSRRGVETSRNLERKNNILSSAQTIYDQRQAAPHRHVDICPASDELPV
jgi:uncharacterized protein